MSALPTPADAGRLGRVLADLLDNAVKYSPGGAVTVRVRAEGAGATPCLHW